jgi:ubiquinone/menaquinone biosynthesis C-methylase UbiE
MQEQRKNPAEVYESFLVPSLFTPWARLLVERAAPQPGERVLDVACGTGIVPRHVAPLVGRSGRVVGFDVSPDMLEVASTIPVHGADVEWVQGNACELDFPAGSFDLVLCHQGLQFFPERLAAARCMHRVLAEGGRAVVAVWQSLDRHELYEALFSAEARHLKLPVEQVATPFSLADEGELRQIFEEAGFSDVTIDAASLEVTFPSAERWVEMTVRAGAAVIPELAHDGEALDDLLETVQRESREVVDRHRQGEGLAFPMYSHIAVARK